MATKGCEWLLPLPCGPGKHRPVEYLRTTLAAIVAAPSTPSQSTTNVVDPDHPDLQAVDSRPTRFASLSYSSFPRHSSKVGAVCVEAPVRFCAGGDQRWSSLPRQEKRKGSRRGPKDSAEERKKRKLAADGLRAIKAKDARAFTELLRQAGIRENSPEWKNAWKAFYSA